jgi:hypothetical protein
VQTSTSRFRAKARPLVLAGALALACMSSAADAAQKIPVLTGKKVGEFQPARDSVYLAWEQNTRAHPNWFNVYARRGAGRKIRVNARGTQGAMGGIQGNSIVYQQFRGGRSDIKFFNLDTHKRRSPQVYVNTASWEYWPSVSGKWLLFGRRNATATMRKVILFNVATLSVRVIDQTTSAKSFISPGQVNGDYVVWHRCRPVPNCNVFRYRISTRLTTRVPNPGNISQHAASVTSDGTVYFARGGKRCGSNVRLLRLPPGGPAAVLHKMRKGRDAGDSFSYTDPNGINHFYFEINRCGHPAGSDIYRIVD